MSDVPDPAPPPPRFPPRTLGVAISDTVGWTAAAVLRRLGPPDGREPGRYWTARDRELPPTLERDGAGGLRRVAVFGPVPQRIEPGRPYEAWTYRNVQGLTCILYFAAPDGAPRGSRIVVETAQFPEGAVF